MQDSTLGADDAMGSNPVTRRSNVAFLKSGWHYRLFIAARPNDARCAIGQRSRRSRLLSTEHIDYIVAVPDDDNTGQLRGEDFMNELDRRIQGLTPEDMLDTSKEDAEMAEDAGSLTSSTPKKKPKPMNDKVDRIFAKVTNELRLWIAGAVLVQAIINYSWR
jgi:hypothetical protein